MVSSSVAAGGSSYERFLICIMYVSTIAIVVFNVEYVWSLSLMICSTVIFFGFEMFNPAITSKEAIGTSVFYAMGIYAATIARKTQSILGKKAFLLSLRSQYRSDALTERQSSAGNTGDARSAHRARQSPLGHRSDRPALAQP